MPVIPNLEAANNGGFLWPSVSDAVDTFLHRRHNNADPYERVWRLIHLWEATEITLALAVMSRLIGDQASTAILRRQREFFYGKTWDVSLDQFKSMQGAADGAVHQWINILDEITKLPEPPTAALGVIAPTHAEEGVTAELEMQLAMPHETEVAMPVKQPAVDPSSVTTISSPGRFLVSVKALLTTAEIDMAPLINSWAKACDVPPDYKRDKVEVRTAMRYVNSFRNRLAHVPFPHDPLGEVADALEAATEQLFSIAPTPSAHEKGGKSSALTGAFRIGRCFLHGGLMESLVDGQSDDIQFVFPCRKKGEDNEVWQAKPMLHLDSMMRPHILTRIKSHDECEYTRFRAEANAVLVQANSGIAQRLPETSKIEYATKGEELVGMAHLPVATNPAAGQPTPVPKPDLTMSEAIEAIRSGDYEPAIDFFRKLTQDRPSYHIGWLRLGYARREMAVRVPPDKLGTGAALLKLAVEDLAKAAHHVEQEYQAQAWYERSKAWYHLARLEQDGEHRRNCLEDAKKALTLSDEKKFLTWFEYVQNLPAPLVATA